MSMPEREYQAAHDNPAPAPSLTEWIASDEFVAEDLLNDIVEGEAFDEVADAAGRCRRRCSRDRR